MKILFDYDGLLYGCVYKVCSRNDIKEWFRQGKSKKWMEDEIINLSINRLSQIGHKIFEEIEETGVEVLEVYYYITACTNSYRKRLSPEYKAKRVSNKWVNKVRKYLIEMNFAEMHDEYEADDLIADKIASMEDDQYIILSPDKDLCTLPGFHFDYYRPRLLDENGERKKDENGFIISSPCRGAHIISKEESDKFFWKQMIMGDASDGVKGIPKMGKVAAEKIMHQANGFYEEIVKEIYQKQYGGLKEFNVNYNLLKLGSKDLEKLF